jgi:glycine C-acetyltransferase
VSKIAATVVRHSHAQQAFRAVLAEQLNNIKVAGTWKAERVITSKQGVEINVQGSSNKILNFCANNYLGLSVNYFILRWCHGYYF